jgi:acrylyl-CoA reductase (NADPH)/3-hydroxypropionyl-CoA dehydratase/3-hydroxypropionyl-CoA synthetase
MARHAAYLATREEPLPLADDFLDDPRWRRPWRSCAPAAAAMPGAHHRRDLPSAPRGPGGGLKHEASCSPRRSAIRIPRPVGIRAFLERRSAPLPLKYTEVPPGCG